MASEPSPSANRGLTNLYTHLQTLIKKWVYDKTEVDNKLSNKENASNKTTALSASSTNTQYPSAKAVYDALQFVEGGGSGLDVDNFYIDTTTDEIVIVSSSSNNNLGGSITIDSTWVNNSTNPVESQLIKTALDNKADSNHTHNQYLTEHQSLTNYIQKNNTQGLIKNDGTIDTNNYLQTNNIIDNLSSTSATAPLSAKQGKILDEKIGNILNIINGNGE